MATASALILASPGQAGHTLPGVEKDLSSMKAYFKKQGIAVYDAIYRIQFKLRDAEKSIEDFFSQKTFRTYIIYYSGHGQGDEVNKSGDWVFQDGCLACRKVLDCWKKSGRQKESKLIIISDSCYAGNWINYIKAADTSDCYYIHFLAASESDAESGDSDEGGVLTKNLQHPHPDNLLETPCHVLTKKKETVIENKKFRSAWDYLRRHIEAPSSNMAHAPANVASTNLQVGMRVTIQRSNGGKQRATIESINHGSGDVTVAWDEAGNVRQKTVHVNEILS